MVSFSCWVLVFLGRGRFSCGIFMNKVGVYFHVI